MSEINRSSRRTSCWITSISRFLDSSRLGKRQCFDRAAERGQRVFELMADIGGKALDRRNAIIERIRHVANCGDDRLPISSCRNEKSGISSRRLDAASHADGRS